MPRKSVRYTGPHDERDLPCDARREQVEGGWWRAKTDRCSSGGSLMRLPWLHPQPLYVFRRM